MNFQENNYNILYNIQDKNLSLIADKILNNIRIDKNEVIFLYQNADLGLLASLANFVREKKNGNYVFYNKNFHIEPTNICVFDCKFCSYSRLIKHKHEGWELDEEKILNIVKSYIGKDVSEVHIVGGVHPKMGLKYFGELIKKIKEILPHIHVKAFTAVELDYMFKKGKVNVEEGLKYLKSMGLDSLPGGGAEIFNSEIRQKICNDKCTTDEWLNIHKTAHNLGIPSNCTMLYGHIENINHRIEHLELLRNLQDQTSGFNTFIPLKFRNKDNQMSNIKECNLIEDIKCYAISRIYLDNFDHIKVYWPMLGRNNAQKMLAFGVDDIDGTIDDSTKIYSMAGAEEQNPVMTTEEIETLIKQVGRKPVLRDSVYNILSN